MKKIWKSSLLLGAISPLVGVSSLMMISCGHKNSTMSWSEFKAVAIKEKAINIVNAIMPPAWKGFTKEQLSQGKFQVDDKNEIINLVITRTVTATDVSSGTFQISYNAQNYDAHNWVTAKSPSNDPNWLRFVNKAKAETAQTLLRYAKTSATWATFKWIGRTTQQKWQTNDKPEWDVYGGTDHQKLPTDVVNIMKGSITADNNAKTVTAIISKVGHEGLYDSDPIKAIITFNNDIYNNTNWVFSKDTQLQSHFKYLSIINPDIDQIINATTKPQLENWIFQNFTSTLRPDKSKHSIGDWMNGHAITNDSRVGPSKGDGSRVEAPISDGLGYQVKFGVIWDDFAVNKVAKFQVTSNFIYARPVDILVSPIGNCFSYTWTLVEL